MAKNDQPDLVPEEPGQTKGAITVMTQAEQAKEHNEKQDDVGRRHGKEGESVTQSDAMKPTEDYVRVQYRAMLLDEIREGV